ncbi:MAG: LysM peptidoglycan-binding domain-containing protein [Anaerolineae bacterium]|nr:LysM peptidoglycan-binding domain-containing protein [Anaerolineae bacterium]
MKKTHLIVLLFIVITAVLAACAAPEPVEVTRVITQDIPVTVEVTRLVPELVNVEKEVEVTRIVEITMIATPTPEAEPTTAATEAAPEPTATTAPPTPAAAIAGNYYTIQPGDTLYIISQKTEVSEEDIMAVNNMSNANILIAGQELLIPGWTGSIVTSEQPDAPAPTQPDQPAAPVGANLLPNGSFEEDWYFFQGVSEWQLPNGWSMSVNEGANNSGSGGLFFRPEIRLLSRPDLPSSEANKFIFQGDKTIKAFKGDAPTNFAIFRDIALQPGSYRFSMSFFPDSVWGYSGSNKVYNGDPLSAEARIIVGDGGTDWAGTNIGSQNTVTYDFTLDTAQTVRLGGAFRNRFEQSNNGWFIDNWTLQKLE